MANHSINWLCDYLAKSPGIIHYFLVTVLHEGLLRRHKNDLGTDAQT